MTPATDQQIYAAFEQGLNRLYEEQQAQELRWGLKLIDQLPRHGLLVALDWQSDKRNTARLRSKVRLAWISGHIHRNDLWNAYYAD
jgi:hypothetical protein